LFTKTSPRGKIKRFDKNSTAFLSLAKLRSGSVFILSLCALFHDAAGLRETIVKKNAAKAVKPDTDAPDVFSPEYFLRAITDVGTMLATVYDRRTGLTRNQTRIVVELLERDGQTQTELANALLIHKVSVGIYVSELEQMGLVERRNHPTDGRAKCIYLTPLLHANKHIGQDHYQRIHAAAIDGIGREDYLTMLKAMERMRDNLIKLDASEKAAEKAGSKAD